MEYNEDINWFLNESDACLGFSSSFGAQIEALQRGAQSGSVDPSTCDPFRDDQISSIGVPGSVDRHRRIWNIWNRLSKTHKEVLSARYTAHFRVQSRTAGGGYEYAAWPTGVRSYLGDDLAGVALFLAREDGTLGQVLAAAANAQPTALLPILAKATAASRAAHQAYLEAR